MANNRELSQLGSIVVVDDSSRNLGIGTTTPDAIVGAGNTAKLSVGILSAYQLYGDGSNLTNVTAAQVGTLADLVNDTTPQLGGDLDVNGNDITGTGNVNLSGVITATSFSGNGANLTAVDATTLDTFDSSQFLRSDDADTKTSGDLLFSNNVKLRLGSGGDLNLYHTGGYSIIENNSGGGDLFIRNNSDDKDIVIETDDGSGGIATYFQADGSTGESILYHYGAQKLATKSTGIDVTGNITVAGGRVGIGTTNPFNSLHVYSDVSASVARFVSGSGSKSLLQFQGTTTTSTPTLGADSNDLTIQTQFTDRVRVTSAGDVGIGVTQPTAKLDVNGTLNVSGVATATSFHTGAEGSAIRVTSNTISGPAEMFIDPSAVGDNTGIVRIKGDLFVDGTQTQINSTTIELADFVVGIATTATSDLLADGAGIEIGPDNTFKYHYNSGTNPSLKSSENLNVASGKAYQIDQVEVLNATTLGSNVVNSSLTSVGTLSSLTVSGNITANGNILGDNATNISGINSITATSFHGDGSCLTNLPAAGFLADAQENLYAGTSAGESSDADTCFNIGIGYSAGASLNSGDRNIFLGCCAGNSTTDGAYNVFLGSKAGANHTSGYYNIAIGNCANASGTTTGYHNVFIGCGAGDCVTGGCDNVYLGRGAGKCVTTARCNIALGFFAGSNNLGGLNNVFLGKNAGGNSTSGNNNVHVGNRAGFGNAGGCHNNFIGYYAGYYNTTGCVNNYFGYAAGYCNCTGSGNNIFGETAGFDLGSGSQNIFIGSYSGRSQTSGDCNIAIGYYAELPNKTGSSQLAIGAGNTNWISGDSSFNVTIAGIATVTSSTGVVEATKFCGDGSCLTGLPAAGFNPDAQENLYAGTDAGASSDADTCHNIGIGKSAGASLNSGDSNVFLGQHVGKNVTSGNYNIALGKHANCNRTGGNDNITLGRCSGTALHPNNSSCNIFIGAYTSGAAGCQSNCAGCHNIGIGQCALYCAGRSDNIAIGRKAGGGLTSSGCNIAIGPLTLNNGPGGNCNIAIGCAAGKGANGINNVFLGHCTGYQSTWTYSENTIIGNCAGQNSYGSKNTFLGHLAGNTNTGGHRNVAIGYDVELPTASGSDQMAIGNCCGTWISGDSNFNVGIGTNTDAAVGAANTAKLSVGIVTANFYYGDGSALTGINAGFDPDADQNLVAGTSAGAALDGANGCYNVFLGCGAGQSTTSGASNIFLGCEAGKNATTSINSIFLGRCAGGWCTVTGDYNIAFGFGTGKKITSGASNIFIGSQTACNGTVTGSCNIVLGEKAGCNLANGNRNIFIGQYAGKGNTSGGYNIVFGAYAASAGTLTGAGNIALGQNAGRNLTTASCNIYIGAEAGCAHNTNSNNNLGMGKCAFQQMTSGYSNIALGTGAGQESGSDGTTISANVFIGNYAGRCARSSQNVFIGKESGRCTLTEGCNIFIGEEAGYENSTGAHSVYIGIKAGKCFVSGSHNIAIGRFAGRGSSTKSDNTGDENIFLGRYAGQGTTSGNNNIALGKDAACTLTGGGYNIVFGNLAGKSLAATGNHNFFGGYQAGCQAIGCYNVFLGRHTGRNFTSGNNNVYIGNCAGGQTGTKTGSSNIAIGVAAGAQGSSNFSQNVFLGHYSAAGGNSTGHGNAFLGAYTGNSLTSGCCNIFIGKCAGNTNTSGDFNIAIGVDVELPSATGDNQFAIGCGNNRWIYGDSSYNIYDKDGNQLNGASSGGGGGLWSQTSVGIHTLSCVGIGTTNPQSKLEVNVGTAVSAFDIQGSAGQLFSVTNNLTSGSIFSVNDVSGIPSIDVDADGTIQLAPYSTTEFVGVGITNPTTKLHVVGEVTATDFNSTSDSRLKTNVQSINDPLAKILQINGVSFNWIENNKPSMGVIADNIEEVVPELVSDTDPKTVNYNGLIGLLIEVVKEQQTQIDSLNERLSRLE